MLAERLGLNDVNNMTKTSEQIGRTKRLVNESADAWGARSYLELIVDSSMEPFGFLHETVSPFGHVFTGIIIYDEDGQPRATVENHDEH